MEIRYLSTTLAGGFPTCPARALSTHERRLAVGDEEYAEDHLEFGQIIHSVAETYHQSLARGEDPVEPTTLFMREWSARQTYDPEYFGFGMAEITEFIDRTLFHRIGETVSTELGFIFDLVHEECYVLQGFGDGEFDGIVDQILAKGGVPIASKIDRVDMVEEDGGQRIEIYDYKTNRVPFSKDDIENSQQLAIYAMAAEKIWPEAESVTAVYDMLRHGRFYTTFSADKLREIRLYLIALWHQIQAESEKPAPVERINSYCSFCHLRLSCETYAQVVRGEGEVERLLEHPLEIEEGEEYEEYALRAWTAYDELKSMAKLVDRRAGEFQKVLMEQLIDRDGPVELSNGQELYLKPNPRYEYPIEDVWAILDRHNALTLLQQAVSVSRPKLDRATRGRVQIKQELDTVLHTNYVKPTVSTRKAEDKEE